MQINTAKRAQNLIFFFAIILLFTFVSLVAANTAFTVTDEIYHGVIVGDISVGGLSQEQAEKTLISIFEKRWKQPVITLTYKEEQWSIMAQDIGLTVDAVSLASKSFQVGRTGSYLHQYKERYLCFNKGYEIPLSIQFDHAKLINIIRTIATRINQDARNSQIQQAGNEIVVVPEVIGVIVDTQVMEKIITETLNKQLAAAIPIPVTQVLPSIRTDQLKDINAVLASYSTEFNSGDTNRSQNIVLAARSINGLLVKPGQEFSFNQIVGQRLAENGYKEAPVFIDGKLVPDWGGGVCQVSSTLYNSVLLADLSVVERTSHFSPPAYVPLGQDATVADNLLDFKFINNFNTNLYIVSDISGDLLTINIYGRKRDGAPEIKVVSTDQKILEPSVIIKQDSDLEFGRQVIEEEGQRGFHVATYRIKLMNGREVGRELISVDDFKAVDRIIRVGSKQLKRIK